MARKNEPEMDINPHLPNYIVSVPWYSSSNLSNNKSDSLRHQRKRKLSLDHQIHQLNSLACENKGFQALTYRKGSCPNCGAITHTEKSCMERPRKMKAKYTGKHIARDEIIPQEFKKLDFDVKHDRWNGFDIANHTHRLSLGNDDHNVDVKVHAGDIRNLRLREDTAKYLWNLDVNSAYYDPKSRSMREDPCSQLVDSDDKFYEGDNRNRLSGQALVFKQQQLLLNIHNNNVQLDATPTQAELLFKINTEQIKLNKLRAKENIMRMYANAP